MKLTRLHVYRGILLGVIVLAFVVGYQRHGNVADAAFTAMIVAFVALTSYVAIPLLDKSLTKNITSTNDGRLYFILGIWGTWEGARTYYFDDLRITVTERLQ